MIVMVWGHPLGNFSLNHYNIIELHAGGIVTQHVLDFAEIPSFSELNNVDVNGDNRVTADEMERYKSSLLERFLPNYTFAIADDKGATIPLVPKLLRNEVILSRGEGSLTCIQIQLAFLFAADHLLREGEHIFLFEDKNLTHMRGVREIRVKSTSEIVVEPQNIQTTDSTNPVPLAENLFLFSGLKTQIPYLLKQVRKMERVELTDALTMINVASIPQFPLEPEADGAYAILKSPLQPNQEVQAKIAMLQPRMVMNATAALFGQIQPESPTAIPYVTSIGQDSAYIRSQSDSQWSDMIGQKDLSAGFVVLAMVFSVFFGAVHALSPGHGKTVVAAYLVGSRGTIYHAIFLGIVVTLTHVSSVLMIGLITLYFSEYIVPDKLFPIIEGSSGLLIVAIGLALFLRRYAAWQRIRFAESMGLEIHAHHHPHPHDHSHPHVLTVGAGLKSAPTIHEHEHEGHPHPHVHDHLHDHDHLHVHDHPHPHVPTVGAGLKPAPAIHEHDHEGHPHLHSDHTDHKHGPGTHTHEIPADATFRDLLMLGITGGIVPCPSAIVVLLVAIAMRRIVFGMAMIVFFSFGLAAVLITIGILMVTARRLLDRFQTKTGSLQWLQIISPVLVMLIGFVIFLRGLQTGGIISFHF